MGDSKSQRAPESIAERHDLRPVEQLVAENNAKTPEDTEGVRIETSRSPFGGEPRHEDAQEVLVNENDELLIAARHRFSGLQKDLAEDAYYSKLGARSKALAKRSIDDASRNNLLSAGDRERLGQEIQEQGVTEKRQLHTVKPKEGTVAWNRERFIRIIVTGNAVIDEWKTDLQNEAFRPHVEFAEKLYDAEVAKLDYERAREAAAREYFAARVAEHRRGSVVSEETAAELAKNDVFQQYVLKEAQIRHQEEVSGWPPEKKAMWKRGIDWYLRQNKVARTLAVSGLIGVGVYALGGASLAAAATYSAGRAIRSFGATGVSRFVGEAVEHLEKKHEKQKGTRETSELQRGFAIEQLQDYAKKYEQYLELQEKRLYWRKIRKAAAMVVSGGALAGIVANWDEVSEAVTEKPSVTAATAGISETQSSVASADAAPPPPEIAPEPVAEGSTASPVAALLPEVESKIAPTESAATPDAEPPDADVEHAIGLTIVHEGEGASQPIYRQLQERLLDDPEKFGIKPEEMHEGIDLSAKVKQTLEARMFTILQQNGFVGSNGETLMGIHPPGARVVLSPDDEVMIENGKTYDFEKVHGEPPVEPPASETTPESDGSESEKITDAPSPQPEPEAVSKPSLEPTPEAIEGVVAKTAGEAGITVVEEPIGEAMPTIQGPERFIEIAHEGDTIEDLLGKQLAASGVYGDRFTHLSQTGKEFLLHTLEKRAELNAYQMGIGDIEHLRSGEHVNFEIVFKSSLLSEDFGVAERFAAMPESELRALEAMEFPKEYIFDQWGYLEVLRNTSVDDFLSKFLFKFDGAIDSSFLGHRVQFYVEGVNSTMPKIDEHYLKLAEKLHELRESGDGIGALKLHEALQRIK